MLQSKLRFENEPEEKFKLTISNSLRNSIRFDSAEISVGNVGIFLAVTINGLSKLEEPIYNELKKIVEENIGEITDFAGDQITIGVENKPLGGSIASAALEAIQIVLQEFSAEIKTVQTTVV